MLNYDYVKLKGVTDWREEGFNDNLHYGLIEWLRWGFLNVGGFSNVAKSQADNIYGGHPSILRPIDNPNYGSGQVWQATRADWVWETEIEYETQPVHCSGVYIDDEFKEAATEEGEYEHYVDFLRGRIIFTEPIDDELDVRADYAYRIPTVGDMRLPWMQELLYGSLSVSREDFLAGTGPYNWLPETRRQMPTIGVELSQRHSYEPFQLGGGQWVNQGVLITVLAENSDDRDKLLNILANQNDKVIVLPNRGEMKSGGAFPANLDMQGRLVENPMQYPDMIDESGFPWTNVRLKNVSVDTTQTISGWLYRGVVRLTCEAIFENI